MHRNCTALALLVTICLTAISHAEDAAGDSAQNVIKNWVATINQNNPDKLLAFYDESEETEVVVSAGLRFRGYKALQKAYKDAFKEVRHYDSSAKDVRTRLLGDTAIVTFQHMLKIHVAADDSHWQMHIRTTSILHRSEKKWKIVLEHSSPIRGVERMTRIEE